MCALDGIMLGRRKPHGTLDYNSREGTFELTHLSLTAFRSQNCIQVHADLGETIKN